MVSGTFAIGAIGWITNTSSSGEAQRSLQWAHQYDDDFFARCTLRSLLGPIYPPRTVLAIDQCRMAGAPAFPLEERRSTPQRASGPEPEAPLFPPKSTPSQSPKRKNRRPLWVYRFCEN